MKPKLLFIFFIWLTLAGYAQEKVYFYLQGEIGPAMNNPHVEIDAGKESIWGYYDGFYAGIACDIETGIKNNSLMVGLGAQLFYPQGTGDGPFSFSPFAPFIKFGCNYFKNKNFFFGNYIAAGFFYEKHNILVNHQVEQAFFFYPHVKTGFYFSKKSLVITLNINEYIKNSDYHYPKYGPDFPSRINYLYNIFSINLEIGYRFDFGKHKEVKQ